MSVLGTGGVNGDLFCKFEHVDLEPTTITLPLGVSGVTWDYKLNTSVTDTYGGQVIQILGVTVTNLVIEGNFGGPDPDWGAFQRGNGSYDILGNDADPNSRFSQYRWINDSSNPWVNGIVQLGDWFRQYFELTTQGGQTKTGSFQKYNQKAMTFKFPGRGWNMRIRPTSFPQVLLANDNVAPQWRVEADFVEDFETDRSFVKDVNDLALERLNALKVGIGFKRENPFSEYTGNTAITNAEMLNKIIDSYSASVDQGLSNEEIDRLIEYGYSFPGNAYAMAGYKPSDVLNGG